MLNYWRANFKTRLVDAGGFCRLVERRRWSAGRGLKSVGQIARRRNPDDDDLTPVKLGSRRTRKADPGQRIFLRILGDYLVLQRSVRDDLRVADERGAGARSDPDHRGAAALDALGLPAGRRGFNQHLVVGGRDEPDRHGLALVAVFAQ